MKEKMTSRVRAHTVYKKKDGTPVVGVTTVCGLRAKPQLVNWANRLGLEGISVTKYVDEKAQIGTCGHLMITSRWKGITPDLKEFPQDIIDKAENCYLSYLNWEKQHTIKPILSEVEMVSEAMSFGGCCDYFGTVDGKLELLDLKTGSNIYKDYFVQLSGYDILLREAGHIPENYRILNIPRTESEEFKEQQKNNLNGYMDIFKKLLDIYYLEKSLDK